MSEQEHTHELSAAYALGALAPEEIRLVDSHCAECRDCAADLAEMKGIAGMLPLACAPEAPSRTLKHAILSAARGDFAAGRLLRESVRRARPPSMPLWTAAAAAVLVAGVGVGTGAYVDHQRMSAEVAQMHDQLASAQLQAAKLQVQADEGHHVLTALAVGRVWDMSGGPPAHYWHCTIMQPPKPSMAMLVAQTPPAPKGMTYQAWVVHKGAMHKVGMVPGGTMTMVHMPMPVEAGDVVAFTVEPMGGSAKPTMPFIMQQTLD